MNTEKKNELVEAVVIAGKKVVESGNAFCADVRQATIDLKKYRDDLSESEFEELEVAIANHPEYQLISDGVKSITKELDELF